MEKTGFGAFHKLCGAPLQVAWAVSSHGGKTSICPLGSKMYSSSSPPMVAISVAPSNYSHELIRESGEFVLAWPGENLARETFFCGTKSARECDKFRETGLTPMPGEHVGAPLVRECLANLECRLSGHLESGDHTIFLGEILAFWTSGADLRPLCLVDDSSGYELILKEKGYRFGAVKR